MKRVAMLFALFALLSLTAGAQMGGGRGMGGGGMTPPPTPVGGAGLMIGGGMQPLVASNGSIILMRALDLNGDNVIDRELVALTPAGTKGWAKSLTGASMLLGLSRDLLLVVEHAARVDRTTPVASTLVAINALTGAESWRLAVEGIPMSATSFASGTYLTVVSPEANSGTAPQTRMGPGALEVWAVDNGGVVLWKYDLRQ